MNNDSRLNTIYFVFVTRTGYYQSHRTSRDIKTNFAYLSSDMSDLFCCLRRLHVSGKLKALLLQLCLVLLFYLPFP